MLPTSIYIRGLFMCIMTSDQLCCLLVCLFTLYMSLSSLDHKGQQFCPIVRMTQSSRVSGYASIGTAILVVVTPRHCIATPGELVFAPLKFGLHLPQYSYVLLPFHDYLFLPLPSSRLPFWDTLLIGIDVWKDGCSMG